MNGRTNHALPLLGLFPGVYIAFSSEEVRLFHAGVHRHCLFSLGVYVQICTPTVHALYCPVRNRVHRRVIKRFSSGGCIVSMESLARVLASG